MSAPSRIDFSFSQTAGSMTHSREVNVPKPQSVDAITRSRSPTTETASWIRRATTSGCSTKFDVEFHHARNKDHVLRKRYFLQCIVFVGMARVGELDRERADFRLIKRRQNLRERDVVDVRAFPVAVADVQADTVARNSFNSLVDRGDVTLDVLGELIVGVVAIEHGAVHRQVWRIDLQRQARTMIA